MNPVIMLVDDDGPFLEELSHLLRSSDYETVEVHDPRTAIEVAQRTRPALILTDLKMPWKNGFEIAFELQEMPGLSDIPVIAMSGLPDQEESVYLELSSIRKCIAKPFQPLDLIWMVEEALRREQPALI